MVIYQPESDEIVKTNRRGKVKKPHIPCNECKHRGRCLYEIGRRASETQINSFGAPACPMFDEEA